MVKRHAANTIDWETIKTEYITEPTASYRILCDKYQVGFSTLSEKAGREEWPRLRREYRESIITKTVNKLSTQEANKLARIIKVSDKLLSKLDRAVDELDLQVLENVSKTKKIEYNAFEKPEKETVNEIKTWTKQQTIIDRRGIQSLASALKDIMDIQMFKEESENEKPSGVVLIPAVLEELTPPDE